MRGGLMRGGLIRGRAETRPIIVTAALPEDLFAMASRLRQAHFPAERNYLDAHLTLFHAIPPSCWAELRRVLADIARRTPPLPARLTGVISLGRGTALSIESRALLEIRDRIAEHFAGSLTAQDSHRPRLHITVQNKVAPEDARALQANLSSAIVPREFRIPGLEVHFYDGGPWEFAARAPFRAQGKHR